MLVKKSQRVARKINLNRLGLVPLASDWLPGKHHYHFRSARRVVSWIDWLCNTNLNSFFFHKVMDEFLTRMYLEQLALRGIYYNARQAQCHTCVGVSTNYANNSNERTSLPLCLSQKQEIRLCYAEACNISSPSFKSLCHPPTLKTKKQHKIFMRASNLDF